MIGPCDTCGRVRPCNHDRECECCAGERYIEYPYDAQHRGFEHIVDMPKAVAEAWIGEVAEEAGLTSYAWDASRADADQTCLMNKGAVLVTIDKFGRHELWIYQHDGQYSLIQRAVSDTTEESI